MIAPGIVTEVRRLLNQGLLSQRKIARALGISRGSVGAIASGRRPDYAPPAEEAEDEPTGPPQRCPGCGAMVFAPCRLCRLQKQPRSSRRNVMFDDAIRLELNLRPDHRARYERVHWLRKQLGNEPATP